jgi:sigma-B regulation protein RsbU (phosphoserine phosphatase)
MPPVEVGSGCAVAGELPAAVQVRFLTELHHVAGPLAREAGAALAYCHSTRVEWITPSTGCLCSRCPGAPLQCQEGLAAKPGNPERFDLRYENKPAGTVLVCRASAALAAALQHLATTTLQRIELERSSELLQTKLTTSWEQLRAVYDVNSHLAAATSVPAVLDRILARAVALQEGAHAVVWLIQDGLLQPVASKNAPPLRSRPQADGLLGRVVQTLKGMVLTAPVVMAEIPRPEPDLLAAGGAAVLPIHTRRQPLGILEVWHDREALSPLLLKVLETLAFLTTVVLESDRYQRDFLQNERVRQDAEIATRIQETLLLGTPPVDLQRIVASAVTSASCQVDGDFYDFFAFDQVLDVVIGDVMGKGITAALVGAATKTHILRAINHLFAANPGRLPEVREILAVVNAELFKKFAQIGCFVTLCYARFDLRRQEVDLLDCGHPSTIHWDSLVNRHTLLRGQNMPLGFGEGEDYKTVSASFKAGDVFLFYSDGVTEAKSPDGQYFGVERLAQAVGEHAGLSPRELAERVRQRVLAFAGPDQPSDDLTCVAVKIGDINATIASKRVTLEILSDPAALPGLRSFLENLCWHQPAAVRPAFTAFEQAVVDAALLIIQHAYLGRRDGTLRFEAELFMQRIAVRIYHRGQALDPEVPGTVDPQTGGELATKCARIQHAVDTLRYARGKLGEYYIYLDKWLEGKPSKGG